MAFQSATLVICEKVLDENGIYSAIRIIDVLNCPPRADYVPADKYTVGVNILAIAKFDHDDMDEHTFVIELLRPEGSTSLLDVNNPVNLGKILGVPDSPKNIVMVGTVGILLKEFGSHCIRLIVDGREVAKTTFPIRLQPEQQG